MSPVRKGPISQRALLKEMVQLVDAARAPNSTAHKDLAMARLRDLLAAAEWRTPFIMWNLNPRRCRWLTNQGWWVPMRFLSREYKHNDEKADAEG